MLSSCVQWAGAFELAWVIGLKYTEGFPRVWPSTGTIMMAMIASLYFLARALKSIPVGTGNAVWTGIAAASTAILRIVLFAESTALPRLVSLGLIVTSIAGLKVRY
jgi:quaternary ammonium compound-resistance protein SugE